GRRASDPPGQARWTVAATWPTLRDRCDVRARAAEPARRDRPGDRTDPHQGSPDRRRAKLHRLVRLAGARLFDDEPHPRLPRQRPLPSCPSRPGLAATAREAHRPAFRAALLPAPQPDRAAVEGDARERHPQPAIRQIPRLRPEGFSDPRVTPLYTTV